MRVFPLSPICCSSKHLKAQQVIDPIKRKDELQNNDDAIRTVAGAEVNLKADHSMSWAHLCNIRYLASGAFCNVFKAEYKGKLVAVKTVKNDELVENVEDTTKALDREQKILEKIDHLHCVKLYGSGTHNGTKFLVLEFLPGGTFNDVIDDHSKYWSLFNYKTGKVKRFHQRLQMCIQLAKALKYIHHDHQPGYTLIHRDLKPQNICISQCGDVKLMDFGISKLLNASSLDGEAFQMTSQTGTPRYMAPEVAMEQPYNHKADTYSFAILCWHLLTLRLPYEGVGLSTFIDTVVIAKTQIPSKWPSALNVLISACWHWDPQERPDFDEIVHALEGIWETALSKTGY